jgi:hypothetical protein|tara:strand:+ start:276 stop:1127 length:852 start_codon:yes stop_codon:yes gene_type:complete
MGNNSNNNSNNNNNNINDNVPIEETTPSEASEFDWSTASKMIEWTLFLFTMLFITSKIIKGIPPSDQIKGVMTSKPKAIWVFAFLSYVIIIVVKVISNKSVELDTVGEKRKTQGIWQIMNILVYFTIVILAYTFCISYMCMKVRRKPIQFGGAFDWMDKGTSDTEVDPSIQMIILIGIILVILNSFTNIFLYLKNQKEAEKDSAARSIYQAQLCVILLMILTLFFLFALGTSKEYISWDDATGFNVFNTVGGELSKVIVFLVVLVGGGIMVNFGAGTETFFGL